MFRAYCLIGKKNWNHFISAHYFLKKTIAREILCTSVKNFFWLNLASEWFFCIILIGNLFFRSYTVKIELWKLVYQCISNFREKNFREFCEFCKFWPLSRKFDSRKIWNRSFAKVYLAKFHWFLDANIFVP